MTFRLAIPLLLLIACNRPDPAPQQEPFADVPELSLPYRINCFDYPGMREDAHMGVFTARDTGQVIPKWIGKITRGNLIILLEGKRGDASPLLFTADRSGFTKDTLALFDKPCYIGVDSDYLPWIEITEDLTVIRSDTAYRSVPASGDDPSTPKLLEMAMKTDTVISIAKYKIESSGVIVKVQ